jgi:hypothetical protein
MDSQLSPEVAVMLAPARAYQTLLRQPAGGGIWLGVRRPLRVAFIFGCAVSLLTSGRLTARLVMRGAVYWSFVPLLETAALAAVCRSQRRKISLALAVDLFFTGFGPWLLWLAGFAAIWSWLNPIQAFAWTNTVWIRGSAIAVLAWSCYIDFCFFRCVLQARPAIAARALLWHRLISWTGWLVCFLGSSMWSVVAGRPGL